MQVLDDFSGFAAASASPLDLLCSPLLECPSLNDLLVSSEEEDLLI